VKTNKPQYVPFNEWIVTTPKPLTPLRHAILVAFSGLMIGVVAAITFVLLVARG
jgi:ABC-type phosphate/phosphonate transport system permease subunit